MNNKEFDILDIVAIISFGIAIMNLDENRKQSDEISKILAEIQEHLHTQDELIKELSEHLDKQDKLLERSKRYEN